MVYSKISRSLGSPVGYAHRVGLELGAARSVSRVRAPLRRNLVDRKRDSTAHNLLLSTSHRPDMTEILLKRM